LPRSEVPLDPASCSGVLAKRLETSRAPLIVPTTVPWSSSESVDASVAAGAVSASGAGSAAGVEAPSTR
jgi:hypothetical protein